MTSGDWMLWAGPVLTLDDVHQHDGPATRFAHSHPLGNQPHDHAPGDRLALSSCLPAQREAIRYAQPAPVTSREFAHEQGWREDSYLLRLDACIRLVHGERWNDEAAKQALLSGLVTARELYVRPNSPLPFAAGLAEALNEKP